MLRIRSSKSSQRGVTLFLAMIVLVAMLLSGIALFRTVDSGVLVAGNIAMQKSATRQGDQGTEDAVVWLVSKVAGTDLYEDPNIVGYTDYPFYVANAVNDIPGTNQTWADWWDVYTATHTPITLVPDATTGNTVSYLIQRACTANGAPYSGSVSCIGPPQPENICSDITAPCINNPPVEVYYRITSRIVGPRNTVSFIQTVISL
jgi:type IV pilus assembly protein PilX